MNIARLVFSLGLVAFVVVPLAAPFRAIVEPATWAWTADDVRRLRHLSVNTLAFTAGTVALSLPLGLLLAVLLFRTSFFARRSLLTLLALSLFVPLPILVSSWQGAFGADGWLPLDFWRRTADRPWATGMSTAIWVHALAATPWVAFIIGLGLSWVEPGLEDEAAQSVGPWRVLALVTLPRVRASVLAAALFVVLQTANEISVTDMMLVSTLAEEVYTQFAEKPDALGRTVAMSLPGLVLVWGAVLLIVARLEKTLPPLAPPARGHRPLELGPAWARFFGAALLLAVLLAPLCSLVWKVGLTGHPGRWSAESAGHFLQAEARLLGKDLLATLATSLTTGILVAGLALTACWLARDTRWFRWLLFSVVTWAWVMPGPVVGIGLHEIILSLPDGPWKDVLYHGPSPLPLMWVQALRALPIAVVFLWPIVRMIPRELLEEARLSGAGALGELLYVVAPTTWRAVAIAALVAAALCLGEVAASTRVETPGWESFTKLVFDRMHYGVANNVSALCVLMLASLGVLALAGFGLAMMFRAAIRERQELFQNPQAPG